MKKINHFNLIVILASIAGLFAAVWYVFYDNERQAKNKDYDMLNSDWKNLYGDFNNASHKLRDKYEAQS